jgi:hypothetical protein
MLATAAASLAIGAIVKSDIFDWLLISGVVLTKLFLRLTTGAGYRLFQIFIVLFA